VSTGTEHKLIPAWIRAHVPECGNVEALVTTHATEALLWRSQGHPVTQVFAVINILVTV
jgi:hypothetical protein